MDTESSLWQLVPHLLYALALGTYGVSLIIIIGPFIYSGVTNGHVFPLIEAFHNWWSILFLSMDRFIIVGIVGLPLGFILTEGLPRSIFLLESKVVVDRLPPFNGDLREHFEFRCKLQETPCACRVWDWESFIYSMTERSQAIVLLFNASLWISYIINVIQVGDFFSVTMESFPIIILSLLALRGIYYWRKFRWTVFVDAHAAVYERVMGKPIPEDDFIKARGSLEQKDR